MKNQSKMIRNNFLMLILGLFFATQTACMNGIQKRGVYGEGAISAPSYKGVYKKKVLKLLTLEERELWNRISDEDLQEAILEKIKNRCPNKHSHLNLEKDRKHFVEYVLEKDTSNEDKASIIYEYLHGGPAHKIIHILKYVDDIELAKGFVEGLCNCLPKHDQQFVNYIFEKYTEMKAIREAIQGYLLSDIADKIAIVLWYKDNSLLKTKLIYRLLQKEESGEPDKAIIRAIMSSNVLDSEAQYNLIDNILDQKLLDVSDEDVKTMLETHGDELLQVIFTLKKGWGEYSEIL